MADGMTLVVKGITGFTSSEAFPVMIMLIVFGVLAAYIAMLWLAHNGF